MVKKRFSIAILISLIASYLTVGYITAFLYDEKYNIIFVVLFLIVDLFQCVYCFYNKLDSMLKIMVVYNFILSYPCMWIISFIDFILVYIFGIDESYAVAHYIMAFPIYSMDNDVLFVILFIVLFICSLLLLILRKKKGNAKPTDT